MFASASVPAAAQTASSSEIVISSGNGLRACARAMEFLESGKDTLDAVIAGVNINEEDPDDNSVGYGGLPNEDGIVELDACVMHGPTRRCGSVASVRNIKYPSRLARLVLENTDHVMLAGDGALRFARAYGMPEENLLTEKSRLAWLLWKRSRRDASGNNNWSDGLDAPEPSAELRRVVPHADETTLAWAQSVAQHPPTGTITCLALNRKGEMSGVTTTSGLAWKIAGRVGDSPILGAGLWVDQDVGAAGSTGRGEENIRVAGAHTIVENMRHGMGPKEACLDALKRVVRNYSGNRAKLERFGLTFYALRKDGEFSAASLWDSGMEDGKLKRQQFAVNQGGKGRLEPTAFLFERKQP
jgi:N4-(beta-N-acetylglucosaminyl)-L-asparaginase